MPKRFKLLVEYDGSQFYGWQKQQELRSVEGCLQSTIEKIAQHPIEIVAAGRTDKGVHASGQVIHFDTNAERTLDNWLLGINRHLPNDISIKNVEHVDEDFHARFSANFRRYCYTICNQKTRPVINRHYATWHYRPLDENKMNVAAQALLGKHDFSTFRDSECQSNTPIRTIHAVNVYREANNVIITIQANAFLHHMVRNIVGSLILVGEGKQPTDWIKIILETRDRRTAGPTAPAQGLCLVEVGY